MTSSPSPLSERPTPRALHRSVVALVALCIAALCGLALVALVPALTAAWAAGMGWGDPADRSPRTLQLVLLGLVALAGFLFWLGRRWTWTTVAVVAVAVVAAGTYLAVDPTPAPQGPTIEEYTPENPDARASHAVLARFGKNQPASRDVSTSRLRWIAYKPEDPQPWIDYVVANRAEIEAEWAKLAPVRAWWDELNAFDRVTDLMPPRLDGETVAFAPVRFLTQRACAIATLQALDGDGDAALATVLPQIEVARKLQESGRSLVLLMIANAVERLAMETAALVLVRAPVSPAMRGRLTAVLQRPGGGEVGARRLVAVERILIRNTLLEAGSDTGLDEGTFGRWLVPLLKAIDPLLYHPRATAALLDAFCREAEELIARRQFDEFDRLVDRFVAENRRAGLRNLGGRLLANNTPPAFGKVGASYWRVQEQRAALLRQVTAPEGGNVP